MHSFTELKFLSPQGIVERCTINSLAKKLADDAVQSLLEEVRLTPKPGLVDAISSGSHSDMDLALFEKSAYSLWTTFYKIAVAGANRTISQDLREEIASIGREGESRMYEATLGINTHKGAIWSLGLITAVSANRLIKNKKVLDLDLLLSDVARLANFPDNKYQRPAYATHGIVVQEKYHVKNALELAQEGFPILRNFMVDYYNSNSCRERNEYLCNLLIGIISQLDDTCILYRSNEIVLSHVKNKASEIVLNGGMFTSEGAIQYQELAKLMHDYKISPGGSADMLAASIFIEKILNN